MQNSFDPFSGLSFLTGLYYRAAEAAPPEEALTVGWIVASLLLIQESFERCERIAETAAPLSTFARRGGRRSRAIESTRPSRRVLRLSPLRRAPSGFPPCHEPCARAPRTSQVLLARLGRGLRNRSPRQRLCIG